MGTVITLQAMGGEPPASVVLAPKLGPLGMSPKKVSDDIVKATTAWKGIRVQVELTVQNRQAAVAIVPTSTALIMRALKEPVRDRKKGPKNILHDGNIEFNVILDIAKQMRAHQFANKGLPS